MNFRILSDSFQLYAITAPGAAFDPDFRVKVRTWLQAGVRAIQLREKMASHEDLLPLGRHLRMMTREYDALFIVNDNPQLALELDADGVHLGQDDMPIEKAREILGPDKIIGLSTHNRGQIQAAKHLEVDYIGVGPVFRSPTKEVGRPLVGPELPAWAAKELEIPVVAIGGIGMDNIGRLVQLGCTNVALISAIGRAEDCGPVAARFLDILRSADSTSFA